MVMLALGFAFTVVVAFALANKMTTLSAAI
jgi:hypothetical protein